MGLTPDPSDWDALGPDATRTLERIRARFPEAYRDARSFRGQLSVWLDASVLIEALRYLKGDPELLYEMLTDLTAVDRQGRAAPGEPRFELVYTLTSLTHRRRLLLKFLVPDGSSVPSATAVWGGANYLERELYDLMGIVFAGHPNLERILTADGWIGHPLRKDFPTMSDQFPNVES